MRSTFMGLETAKRGMFTQQGALYVTGNNISNANTVGYTRQRANMVQTDSYPYSGMNRPGIPGQIGTGVTTGSIERVRDSFLDQQIRQQNNSVGYYNGLSDALGKMEQIMNEPSTSGLQSTMDKFWNSLQTLAANTENSGARDVVASTGQMVADTFNYYYNSLTRVQTDLGNQISVKTTDINETIKSIAELNQKISEVEPHGMLPNDLYDQRDALVDQLSSMVNINVTRVQPTQYGNALPQADGLYNIELVKDNGKSFVPPINLIAASDTGNGSYKQFSIDPTNLQGSVDNIVITDSANPATPVEIAAKDFGKSGELSAIIQAYGYDDGNGGAKGSYPDMLKKLNDMAYAFGKEFNAIHNQGYILDDGTNTNIQGRDFFEGLNKENAAQTIKVKASIIDNPSTIAAGGTSGKSGDNQNAQKLANIKKLSFSEYSIYKGSGETKPDSLTGNIDRYYAGIIGKLGVESKSAQQNLKNASTIAASVEERRQSVSEVSLDEEMVNMIKFQHAYNASARNITMIDEMLDKIINGMGVVGR